MVRTSALDDWTSSLDSLGPPPGQNRRAKAVASTVSAPSFADSVAAEVVSSETVTASEVTYEVVQGPSHNGLKGGEVLDPGLPLAAEEQPFVSSFGVAVGASPQNETYTATPIDLQGKIEPLVPFEGSHETESEIAPPSDSSRLKESDDTLLEAEREYVADGGGFPVIQNQLPDTAERAATPEPAPPLANGDSHHPAPLEHEPKPTEARDKDAHQTQPSAVDGVAGALHAESPQAEPLEPSREPPVQGRDEGLGARIAADGGAVRELRMLLDERERQLERLGQQAADAARQVGPAHLAAYLPCALNFSSHTGSLGL